MNKEVFVAVNRQYRPYGESISAIGRQAAGCALAVGVVCLLMVFVSPPAQGQKLRVLYAFRGLADGGSPIANVIQDKKGNLYGAAYRGGTSCNCGTVFQVDTSGKETVLYSFTGIGGSGEYPSAGLVRDTAGNLYGSATGGETGNNGYGVIFRVDTTGTETVLYTFTGMVGDGEYPVGSLLRDAAGTLYGATNGGGASGYGTVFKLDSAGTETVLYSFGGTDGAFPAGGLVRDAQGSFYGATYNGGAYGYGAVFKLDTNGKETVLHSFNVGDGAFPSGALVRDAGGALYGVTVQGGANYYYGTVYKVDTKNKESVLHSFTGGRDGAYPEASLIRDKVGNLYGTAVQGGDLACYGIKTGCGTVFSLNTRNKETVLHRFSGGIDGAFPFASLVRDGKRNFYGTDYQGGAAGYGTVFKLTP